MDKVTFLQNMLAEKPEDGQLWLLLGMEHKDRHCYDEALEAFTRALSYTGDETRFQIIDQLAEVKAILDGRQAKAEALKPAPEEPDHPAKVIPLRAGREPAQDEQPPLRTDVDFSDVGGLEELKQTIRMRIIKPFQNPEIFVKFNKKIGGGLLLYGPPGCGKTFIAKATAGECSARFYPVHIHDILDKYVGESEKRLRAVFEKARANKPAILFFDEIDAIGFHRGKSTGNTLRSLVDLLLTEMEGVDAGVDQVLVIGATNMPWDVDPAFKRPGRFDRMLFVPPPDRDARDAIFRLKLKDKPVGAMDYAALAKATPLFSGADIDYVIDTAVEAVLQTFFDTGEERPLETGDLTAALKKTSPSTLEWLRTMSNYLEYATTRDQYQDVLAYLKSQKL